MLLIDLIIWSLLESPTLLSALDTRQRTKNTQQRLCGELSSAKGIRRTPPTPQRKNRTSPRTICRVLDIIIAESQRGTLSKIKWLHVHEPKTGLSGFCREPKENLAGTFLVLEFQLSAYLAPATPQELPRVTFCQESSPSSQLIYTSNSTCSPFYRVASLGSWQIVSRAANTYHMTWLPRVTLGKEYFAEWPSRKKALSAFFLIIFHITYGKSRYNSNMK